MKKALLIVLLSTPLFAQVDPRVFNDMRWRMIGPFRGGRTVAAVGVRQQPNVFYIGVNNGGVWKTTDYGRVWTPVFDDQPTGSIGAIAVAPSDPNVLYVGSGEGLQRPDLSTGDGIYKSTDAGATWTHLGLRDGQQIPAMAVDPADPNRLFVAVLGHPYGPNAERGIFRSTDGGRTFEKVLYRDENTGGMDVMIDPRDSNVVYGVLWEARQGPWENGSWSGRGSGFFKSTDGGTTWRQITKGLPGAAEGLGRIGFDVSQSDPKRLFAIVGAKKGAGLYRSDDAGESWALVNTDERLWGRDGDFNEVRIDPKAPDRIYIANIVTWQSADGGKTFSSFRGAPGGDDYHRLWINPDNPDVILNASDQGAVITVNRGSTWSSWYNQPTAQMYHVNTDNAFPYRVCSGQQESGSACVESRSDEGAITFRNWRPVGVEEYGYVVPDPLNPDIVYGGKLERFDWRTKQVQQIAPKAIRDSSYRVLRTMPVVFSAADPHILFFASNTVWKTTTGGKSWTQISPDLTRKTWGIPANVGKYTSEVTVTQRGVVYALAPSPLDVNRLWAGTDDGLIHVTVDGGKTWKDVTPTQLTTWAKVSIMEASHFDAQTAYAAINTFRLDDLRPHILRTRDGGKTWTEIVDGIPAAGIINVVREDPKTRGLLFAGSEREVYVSFDDGDHWQTLRLNMAPSSIRDLTLNGDDLIAGTHGRGFWILDDIEPLRQAKSVSRTSLFKPQRAWRYRWSKYPDTPMPPDEPAGQNPPDGAVIDYYLAAPAQAVTLEILDGAGKVIRKYASSDRVEKPKDEGNVPWYWIRPPQVLSTAPGMHRFTWDLHYTPASAQRSYPISAIPFNTAPSPSSPWVLPGTYTVRLNVDGKSMTRPLTVRMDPRVKTSAEGLKQQFDLSMSVYRRLVDVNAALSEVRRYRAAVKGNTTTTFERRLAELEGEAGESGVPVVPGAGKQPETLGRVRGSLSQLLSLLQGADVAPTTQGAAAARDRIAATDEVLAAWKSLREELQKANITPVAAHLVREPTTSTTENEDEP
jgi:photosystem II stability/assembly factor-like uncharacterized protein